MKEKIAHLSGVFAFFALITAVGCSTTQLSPEPAPAPSPPPYVHVPHPAGTDLADLRAIFHDPTAPSAESTKDCEKDFLKLKKLAQNEEELRDGARELVSLDPVKYHWCFYTRLSELQESLASMQYIDEKQKKVLETYAFLVPVARGFLQHYHDSRYLRWSVLNYKRISEWVFFRKLELSPEETAELVQIANPFGLWREETAPDSILEKYGIVRPETPEAFLMPPVPESPQK